MKVAACMRASSFAISFSRSVSEIVSSCASAVPMPLNACILRERHSTRCSTHAHFGRPVQAPGSRHLQPTQKL